MIEGLGNDIIAVERIASAINRRGPRFLERLFTEKERLYCNQFRDSIPHFAGRFAAKEAIVKALGTGFRGISWHDIEIINNDSGKPVAHFTPRLQEIVGERTLLISISHCKEYATAVAVLYSENGNI